MTETAPPEGTDQSPDETTEADTYEAPPTRVPNVTPGAKSGLDHEVIGSAAQDAYDVTHPADEVTGDEEPEDPEPEDTGTGGTTIAQDDEDAAAGDPPAPPVEAPPVAPEAPTPPAPPVAPDAADPA